jgi:hypothetical protein
VEKRREADHRSRENANEPPVSLSAPLEFRWLRIRTSPPFAIYFRNLRYFRHPKRPVANDRIAKASDGFVGP